MRSEPTAACLTRIVRDDGRNIEVAELCGVLRRIEHAIEDVIPSEHRSRVADALLAFALEHLQARLLAPAARTRM